MQHSVVHFECSESSGSWSYNGEGTTECFNGETQGENNNGKMVNSMAGQGFTRPARCLSCIFHGFGFCVFRTLDRAVRECVPYGCAFLTKGNAAR